MKLHTADGKLHCQRTYEKTGIQIKRMFKYWFNYSFGRHGLGLKILFDVVFFIIGPLLVLLINFQKTFKGDFWRLIGSALIYAWIFVVFAIYLFLFNFIHFSWNNNFNGSTHSPRNLHQNTYFSKDHYFNLLFVKECLQNQIYRNIPQINFQQFEIHPINLFECNKLPKIYHSETKSSSFRLFCIFVSEFVAQHHKLVFLSEKTEKEELQTKNITSYRDSAM